MIKSWLFTLFIISALLSPSMAQSILFCVSPFPQGYINTVHQGMTKQPPYSPFPMFTFW